MRDGIFKEAWIRERVPLPARRRGTSRLAQLGLADSGFVALRLLGFSHLLLLALTFASAYRPLTPLLDGWTGFRSLNPGLTLNALMRDVVLATLCFMGAYNGGLRLVVASLGLVAYAATCATSLLLLGAGAPSHSEWLVQGLWFEGAKALIALALVVAHRRDAALLRPEVLYSGAATAARRLLRYWFLVFACIELGLCFNLLNQRLFGDQGVALGLVYSYPDPCVVLNASKFLLLAALFGLMAASNALREAFHALVSQELALGICGAALWLAVGDSPGLTGTRLALPSGPRDIGFFYGSFIVSELPFLFITVQLRKLYYDRELRITSLSPSSARAVQAFHDTLHGASGRASKPDIAFQHDSLLTAQRVARYAAALGGKRRGVIGLPFFLLEHVLAPWLWLSAPFSSMAREERGWLLLQKLARSSPNRAGPWQPLLAAAHALVTFAHYGSRFGQEGIYVPPEARTRLQSELSLPRPTSLEDAPASEPPPPSGRRPAAPRLSSVPPRLDAPERADFLIIGSGPGGAVAAYRLAELCPDASIVVVERGPRVSPTTDFNEDEVEMVSRLYKDGGLQQTRGQVMTLLQAECVGGGSLVNNGICARLPPTCLLRWQNDFGLESITARLDAEYLRIADEIGIRPISSEAVNARVLERFLHGAARLEDELEPPATLSVNATQAQGTGQWNLGDRHLRKATALQTYLAWAEALGGGSKREPRVRILAETTAIRCSFNGKRATSVLVQRGQEAPRSIEVGRAVVVAAGVVASTQFLMRSELDNPWLGRHVSCNLALPSFAVYDQRMDAFDGLEITHSTRLRGAAETVFETHFLPPGLFSLAVPFYLNRHHDLMQRYRHLTSVGCLVGSEPRGVVRRNPHWLDRGLVDWSLGKHDLAALSQVLSTQVKLAQAADARRIVLCTNPGIELELPEDASEFLKRLEAAPPLAAAYRLATAHPQGGNRMAADAASGRVVDTDFRVAGFDNVYVADASVFPSSIGTNPQWTIMACSSLAAQGIAATHGSAGHAARSLRTRPESARAGTSGTSRARPAHRTL